jgi:RNA polymerase sigma-70 factor (ECF subfamily)
LLAFASKLVEVKKVQSVDIATIHACQRGDREAFRRIYEACHRKVYGLAYRYTNDPQEALDLSQEIFLRIHTHIADFRGECALETWIYRVATNTIIGALRKSRRNEQLVEEIETHPDTAPLPEACLEGQEMERRIERAIIELPESQRMAFVLVAVERRPYAEVADILDLRTEAVRMRVSRARKTLRATLKAYLDEGKGNDM